MLPVNPISVASIDFKAPKKQLRQTIEGQIAFFLREKGVLATTLNPKRLKLIRKNACKTIQLKHSLPKDSADLKALFKEINQILVPISSLEIPPCSATDPALIAVYNGLLNGNWEGLKNASSILPAILYKKDPVLLNEARLSFQNALIGIYSQLPGKDAAVKFTAEAIVGNILAYYTFFDPPEGSSLQVPILAEGSWKLLDYTVERIALTPSWMGSPITAFGLVSKELRAPPLLLFKGTTFPADDGFGLSLLADINPFCSVGAYAFKLGKKKIERWLERTTKSSDCKARIFGQSLGGALTLHTAAKLYPFIEKAFALSPPALLKSDLRVWEKESKIGRSHLLPEVHVFCHQKDIVPMAGFKWAKEWNLYHIFPAKKKNAFVSHAECFISQKGTLVIKGDVKSDQNKLSRLALATLHLLLSLPLFVLGVVSYALFLLVKKLVELAKKVFHSRLV